MEINPKETINEIVNKPHQKQVVAILLWLLFIQYLAVGYIIYYYDKRELETGKKYVSEMNYLKGQIKECQTGKEKIYEYLIGYVSETTKQVDSIRHDFNEIKNKRK